MATESTNVKFSCPHCGQHLAVESDKAGLEFDCPSCGKKVIVNTSNAEENGVAIDINSNINTLKSEEVAQDSATSSDNNTVTNDNPFLKDWENAKAKAKAGGEVAKEYGKKAARTLGEAGDALKAKWEEESVKNRKDNPTHGEWLALKFKVIKDTLKWSRDMLYARFPLLEKICSVVKSFVSFCLASVWFVFRSIAQGISWIVTSSINKIFPQKKPVLTIRPVMWIWEKVFLSIDAKWLNYESKRTISTGRKIAYSLVGCVIIGIIVNGIGVDSSDSYYSGYSSYSSSSEQYSDNGNSVQCWLDTLEHSESPTLIEQEAMKTLYNGYFGGITMYYLQPQTDRTLIDEVLHIIFMLSLLEDTEKLLSCPEDFRVTFNLYCTVYARQQFFLVCKQYGESAVLEALNSANIKEKSLLERCYATLNSRYNREDFERSRAFEKIAVKYNLE